MNNQSLRRRFLICAVGAVFLCLLLSRTVSILFSYAATDILYSESVLPTVLSYLRQIFAACACGAGIAAMCTALYADDRRTALILLGAHSGLLLIDVLCAFASDAFSGAVEDVLLGYAALFNLGDWLISVLLLALAYLCMRRCRLTDRSSSSALIAASLVSFGMRMILQLFYIVQFLIEVEFSPYASEIIQMVGEILQVIVMSGGAVWLSAAGMYMFFAKIRPAGQ